MKKLLLSVITVTMLLSCNNNTKKTETVEDLKSDKIIKIHNMFNALSAEEQNAVVEELIQLKKKINIDTSIITEFALRHQKEYQKEIFFEIKKEDDTKIIAVLNTVFGKFTGYGTNQKFAKINAVKLANEAWDD